MFTKKEIEGTKDYIRRKKEDILNMGDKMSNLEYIKSLQTLVKLEDAINQKIHSIKNSE